MVGNVPLADWSIKIFIFEGEVTISEPNRMPTLFR